MVQEFERQGEYVMAAKNGQRPIKATTVTGWALDTVSDEIEGFQLKRIRSGVQTLLADRAAPMAYAQRAHKR